MAPLIQKITEESCVNVDLLEQALEQASRTHQKVFDFDRLNVIEDFSCDEVPMQITETMEQEIDASSEFEISSLLFDLVQDLKLSKISLPVDCDDYDSISNEDIIEDLQLTMQHDMNALPDLLKGQDEGDFLEQALEFVARQYERSFASDRLTFEQHDLDDSDLFYDCVELEVPEETYGSQISDILFDLVQDTKDMKLCLAEDLDEFWTKSENFVQELELDMLKDMNSLPGILEPEIIVKLMAPHPKKAAVARSKCMLPSAGFVNARTPCGGMSCASPKWVGASPASAAWRAQMV